MLACAIGVGSYGIAPGTNTASAYCRTGMGIWGNPSVSKTIGLNTTFPSAMRSGLAASLAQWNQPSSVLRYNAPVYTSGWQIYAFRGSHSYSTLMGSAPGIASGAQTNNRTSGELILSNQYTWVNGSQNITGGTADVQTIAVHEVGHFTGLAHPWIGSGACSDGTTYTTAEQGSVMTTINTGTRRNLNSDDIAAVQAIY